MEDRFCTNCGSKLTTEAEFCGNCGTKQMETEVEFKDRGTISMFNENNNSSGSENSSNSDMLNNAIYGQSMQTPPKKKNTGLIIGIVAAVLLVLAFIGMTAEKSLQNAEYGSGNSDVVETNDDFTLDTDSDDEKEYVKGAFTDTTYVSDFIGIKYTAPDGWVLATESELEQMPTDYKTTWEMQAISGLDGSNVIVAVEKLPTKNFTESMYINSLKNTLENNTQITVSDIKEDGTKMIAGKEYYVLIYSALQNGVSYNQTFYLRKINAHIVALIVTSLSTGNDEILSGFSAY